MTRVIIFLSGENLLILCMDLFLAGSKTTTDTLASTFVFLALHPEWIKVLQEEMDTVVGRTRSPSMEDYPSLPMMEAFLAEVIGHCRNNSWFLITGKHFFRGRGLKGALKYTCTPDTRNVYYAIKIGFFNAHVRYSSDPGLE